MRALGMGSDVLDHHSGTERGADAPATRGRAARQTRLPVRWVIVENGSSDQTAAVAERIVAESDWARLVVLAEVGQRERGAPIVRALHAGLAALDVEPDVVVNVDADVTMEPDYFERLLDVFAGNPLLGIASGSAWELTNGAWRQRFVTGGTVWGATRAYRWACLQDVLPLEERHGWDGIDQLKARARGWETRTLTDLPFRHHRTEGLHDGSTWAHWLANGDTAYYMGYRPSYLLVRTLHRMRRDPAAFGLDLRICVGGGSTHTPGSRIRSPCRPSNRQSSRAFSAAILRSPTVN